MFDVMDSVSVIALNSASGRCFEPTMRSLPTTQAQVEQLISYRLKYCACEIAMGAAHNDHHRGRWKATYFRNVVAQNEVRFDIMTVRLSQAPTLCLTKESSIAISLLLSVES